MLVFFSSDDDSMFVLLFCDVLCYLDLDRFFFEIEHQIMDTMCSTVTFFHVRKKDQGIQTFEKLYWANKCTYHHIDFYKFTSNFKHHFS